MKYMERDMQIKQQQQDTQKKMKKMVKDYVGSEDEEEGNKKP